MIELLMKSERSLSFTFGFAVRLASNGPKIPSLIYMVDVKHHGEAVFLPRFHSCQRSRLFVAALTFISSAMKDCKNRRRDQRRSQDTGGEK